MDRKTTDSLDELTTHQLIETILRESAKSSNELRSAENDIAKAQRRLRFCVMLANRLLERID